MISLQNPSIKFRPVFISAAIFVIFSQLTHAQVPSDMPQQISTFLTQNPVGYKLLSQASKEIGHRLTGTKNGRAAETFVFNQLKNLGIQQVEYDSFSVKTWRRSSCKLEIVPWRSDNYVRVEAVALANTSSATAIYQMVDGGDGLESDLKKIADKIKGNCLLINLGLTRTDSGRKNLHRAEKVALALKYGANAVIMVHPSESDKLLTGTASLTGNQVPIPALCISGKDGKWIREVIKSERLMADFNVVTQISNSGARNVIARFQAPVATDETIIFCGHLDCWDLATGATDNGLGAFTLIDLARSLEMMKPYLKRNVLIMWTMGEEQGLLGSTHFVENLKKSRQLKNIEAVINLDMTGNPVGFNDSDWPNAGPWFEEMNKKIAHLVPTYKSTKTSAPGLHSDHQPFMLEGIPNFSANSEMPDSIYQCYHSNCDNINLVQPSFMNSSALVHSFLAMELGTADRLPFEAMPKLKLKKWLEKHGLKEKLLISNQWPWKK